jgi:RNA polymerase sigma-70 factor (ECF subfamily)
LASGWPRLASYRPDSEIGHTTGREQEAINTLNTLSISAASPGGSAAPPRETLTEEQLTELYRRHRSEIMRMLLRGSSADRGHAEDVLQETFVRAWQHPESVARGLDQALPWLLTVARRIAIDHYRMRAARPQELCDEVPLTGAREPDLADRILADRDVEVALAELTPRLRDVLFEVHVRDRSLAQAAETLGVPVGTVKSRMHHAVRALRPVFEAHGIPG